MKRGIVISIVSLLMLTCSGCFDGSVTPLANGIRMYNRYKLGFFSQAVPIAGAYDQGFAEAMGTVSGQETLSGYSDEDGILDSTGVTLGVVWSFSWNYSGVMPECGISTDPGVYVPEQGFAANGVCDLY
jgi:hypothetical protein